METIDRVNAVLKAIGFELDYEQPIKEVLDSLDKVEFVMMLEQEFNILITDEEISEVNTLEDVVKMVNRKLDAK